LYDAILLFSVLQAKFSHEKFSEYAKKYGPVFQVYLGMIL